MAAAANWEGIWSAGLLPGTAFDMARPHLLLEQRVLANEVASSSTTTAKLLPQGARCLVPGCGRGYDVVLLARSPAVKIAVGLDYAPSGAAAAEAYVRGTGADPARFRIDCADFFTYKPSSEDGDSSDARFDFVYDYTFFCAIPPARRGEWGAQMAALVRPGGHLFCLQFPLADLPGRAPNDFTVGPPFRLTPAMYDAVLDLGRTFEVVESGEIDPALSHPRRVPERFAIFRRL